MERVLKIFNSHSDQARYEYDYWKTVNPETRVEILEAIRSIHMEVSGEGKQGFQRIFRIVERS